MNRIRCFTLAAALCVAAMVLTTASAGHAGWRHHCGCCGGCYGGCSTCGCSSCSTCGCSSCSRLRLLGVQLVWAGVQFLRLRLWRLLVLRIRCDKLAPYNYVYASLQHWRCPSPRQFRRARPLRLQSLPTTSRPASRLADVESPKWRCSEFFSRERIPCSSNSRTARRPFPTAPPT